VARPAVLSTLSLHDALPILGAIIVGVAVGGLAFGAVYGQQREWRDPVAYMMLAVGAIATIGLPFYMARARNPLIPLSLFKSRALDRKSTRLNSSHGSTSYAV